MLDRDTERTACWEEEIWGVHPLMERSNINRNTYLNCWCPSCGEGLNEDGRAVFRTVNQKGEVGIRHVPPYLNVLERMSFLQMEDKQERFDVSCPHCNVMLTKPDQTCKQDQGKMAKIHISVQDSIKLSLTFCIRHSCGGYIMSEEDNERLILRESQEW